MPRPPLPAPFKITPARLKQRGISMLDLAASRRSTLCPICCSGKAEGRSLCLRCDDMLPRRMRRALDRADAYPEAIAAALDHVDAETFQLEGRVVWLRGGGPQVI